jgi:hypothetical protein
MDWVSKTVNKARNQVDRATNAVSSVTVPIYQNLRDKGMNKREALTTVLSGGMLYGAARASQAARAAEEDAQAQNARNAVIQAANDRAARMSQQVRMRRRGMGNLPSNKGGTLLTGALGLLGNSSSTLGA